MSTATIAPANDKLETAFGNAQFSAPIKQKALLIYAANCCLGLIPAVLGLAPAWQAAGFGLLLPGAGFLVGDGWLMLLFPLTLVAMLVAYLLFQLMANLVAPLAVWCLSLLLSAFLAPEVASDDALFKVLGVTALSFGGGALLGRRTLKKERKRLAVREAFLPDLLRELEENAADIPEAGSRELSEEDLAHLRYVLDRGLQPVDSFEGFDVIEQFQTSAIRYQLNYLLWSLQVAQCHYTPNFHGYLNEAQRNLIDKLTVPVVWKWWRWESLLGNFSLNADPIAKDNIMFGAFTSANIAMYTANTGDDHYLQLGSLTFVDNEWQQYPHSLITVLEVGRKNHVHAVYKPLYPCEPKLTYSACNLWGNIVHLAADRVLGTQYGPQLTADLRPGHVSEMLGIDGSPHSGRINFLGLRMPVYTCNFVSAQWAWMAAPFFDDLTKRTWAVLRKETINFDAHNKIQVDTKAYDRIDIGNYKLGDGAMYGHYLILANELGDKEVGEPLMEKIESDYGRTDVNGSIAYANLSNMTNAVIAFGRMVRRGDIRKMVLQGPGDAALNGPLLSEASYPDVLVAKAFSSGKNLELVLYPGDDGTQQTLGISRLQPNAKYQVRMNGEEQPSLPSDEKGTAELLCELQGRTEILIEPVGA